MASQARGLQNFISDLRNAKGKVSKLQSCRIAAAFFRFGSAIVNIHGGRGRVLLKTPRECFLRVCRINTCKSPIRSFLSVI